MTPARRGFLVHVTLVAVITATSAVFPAGAATRTAPPKRPTITFEQALTLRSASDLTWSGDGTRLAFVVSGTDTSENTTAQDIWLADLRVGRTWRLTRHPKPDLSPTFSPGGDTLAFVSTRAEGEDAKPGIYMMSLRGGEPWAFGRYAEGVGEVEWSPDGRYLAYVMSDTLPGKVREWRKKKWDQVVEDERLQYPRLWVTEIATGKARQLTFGETYVWNVRWSPDSRSIAFLVSPTGKPDDGNLVDIGVVAPGGGAMRRLGVIGGTFAWSPDSRWIACATAGDRRSYVQKSDLWVIPAAGGKAINRTADFDGDAQDPAWCPTSDTLYFHAEEGVSTRAAAVPLRAGGVTLGLDRKGEAGTPFAASNGRVAWVQSRPTEPGEVWIADHFGLPGRALTTLNESVLRLRLSTPSAVRWTSSDGVQVEGLLLRPPGAAPGTALKTLVLLHGGPYGARYALGFQALQQVMAAHGYQIFMPNFRSSAGYGTAFMLRKRADWGGQDWRDVESGVDTLVRRHFADGKRLGVYGHSYGGYLAAWAITQTDRFDAACVSAGAVDLGAHYGQSDIQKYRAYDFEGLPWAAPDNWKRASPITYVQNVKTPTLVQSGDDDRRVPYPQGQELYRALLALGVSVEFAHYPREGHGLREYRHRYDHARRILDWFDRWVK